MDNQHNTNKKISAFALGASFSAVSVVLLYISGLLPTMRLALSAVAGLFCAAMLITYGVPSSLLVYFTTSLLSLFLLPSKTPSFLYASFFGYYPVLKYLIEKLRSLPVEWILKLFSFNFAFTLISYLSLNIAGFGIALTALPLHFLYIAANIGFILYDVAFSFLIAQFRRRFYR